MNMASRVAVCAIALVAVLLGAGNIVGQGVSSASTAALAQQKPVAAPHALAPAAGVPAAMPSCANTGKPVALPSDFPASFPLPPGTLVTSAQQRSGGGVIGAVVPSDAHTVAVFLDRALPASGFKNGVGESEPGDAESTYAGQGYQGRWRARDLRSCPGTVSLAIFASPLP